MSFPSEINPSQQRSPTHLSYLTAKPATKLDSQTPPSHFSIAPITASTLSAYRRLISLLLPIRYPDKFYKESIANPSPTSLALCASWPDIPRPSKRKLDSSHPELSSSTLALDNTRAKVVGGIQCRLELLPCPPPTSSPITNPTTLTAASSPRQQPCNLYIQTLAVLSPYRSFGIATALLDTIISTALTHYPCQGVNVKEIYAHVWEANEEALEWYMKRGFDVGGEVVEGYYKKLRPGGARVVRRRVGVVDWVDAGLGWKGDTVNRCEGVEKDHRERLIIQEESGHGGVELDYSDDTEKSGRPRDPVNRPED